MPLSKFAYDPWELPPEQRRTTFVGREPILDRLLAAIREQEGRDTVQHYMLTGPRGIGVGGSEKGVHFDGWKRASGWVVRWALRGKHSGVRNDPGFLRLSCRPVWGRGRDTTCL